MDMDVPGKRRRVRPRRRRIKNNRKKYEMTADMTENRQYWKIMKTVHKDVDMVSKVRIIIINNNGHGS